MITNYNWLINYNLFSGNYEDDEEDDDDDDHENDDELGAQLEREFLGDSNSCLE